MDVCTRALSWWNSILLVSGDGLHVVGSGSGDSVILFRVVEQAITLPADIIALAFLGGRKSCFHGFDWCIIADWKCWT